MTFAARSSAAPTAANPSARAAANWRCNEAMYSGVVGHSTSRGSFGAGAGGANFVQAQKHPLTGKNPMHRNIPPS
jgi:hypothetical protein